MILTFTSPVKLCAICLSAAGILNAAVAGATQGTAVNTLPTSTQADVDALLAFLDVATACPHIPAVSDARVVASDEWINATACLAALPPAPAPPDVDAYAAIRARYTSLVAAALARATTAGGLA